MALILIVKDGLMIGEVINLLLRRQRKVVPSSVATICSSKSPATMLPITPFTELLRKCVITNNGTVLKRNRFT